MLAPGVHKQFLTKTDETGRFIVTSQKTGIAYYFEPLDGGPRRKWGDMNPATKETEGAYGTKYKGSVAEDESLITEDNGFENIRVLEPGVSPYGALELIDEERYAQGYRPGINPNDPPV